MSFRNNLSIPGANLNGVVAQSALKIYRRGAETQRFFWGSLPGVVVMMVPILWARPDVGWVSAVNIPLPGGRR
jgi:hypothetical protein